MSDLIKEALKDEDTRELYYDRKATLTCIDNYICQVDSLHAKESHTRSSIDRYYKLKADIPKILDKANNQNSQLLAALYNYNIAIQKDVKFISDQTELSIKIESLEDKLHELSVKLKYMKVIAKQVSTTQLAPS